MVPLHPQFIADESNGARSVVLPLDEWVRIIEDLEELDDIRAYDTATSEPDEAVPFKQAVEEIRTKYDP